MESDKHGLRATIERLTRERDEAREDARRRLEEANSQQRIAIKREEERDEARERAENLRLGYDSAVASNREENARLRAEIEEARAEARNLSRLLTKSARDNTRLNYDCDRLREKAWAVIARCEAMPANWWLRPELEALRAALAHPEEKKPMTYHERVQAALECIHRHGGHDGEHHKQWVLDQVVQILTCFPDRYAEWVIAFKAGPDGPDTYHWDEGIAP